MYENVTRMRVGMYVSEDWTKISRGSVSRKGFSTHSEISYSSKALRVYSKHQTDQFCFSECSQGRSLGLLECVRKSSSIIFHLLCYKGFQITFAILHDKNAVCRKFPVNFWNLQPLYVLEMRSNLKFVCWPRSVIDLNGNNYNFTFSVFFPSWRKSSSTGRFFLDSSTSHWNLKSGKSQPMIFTQYSMVWMSILALPLT